MSSFSNLTDDAFWRRIDETLAPIPHEGNRATLRRYLKERLANGIRTSTLANDANHIRGLCVQRAPARSAHAGRRDRLRHARVRPAHVAQPPQDGHETVTTRRERIGEGTLSIRRVIIRCFVQWLRGMEDDYPK